MMSAKCNCTRISVIIPTYNRGKFLTDAVNSVINQNYVDVEIVIVDDGSDDKTQEVVNSLQKKHLNIIYCHNERAKGPSGARNTGLLKATGDYIAFLDSDDVWLEGHLSKGIKMLEEHPDIDILFGNFRIVDLISKKYLYDFFDHKKILHTLKSSRTSPGLILLRDNMFKALLQENFIHFGSMIVRKSSARDILLDENIMYAEDRDFAIQLYNKANATFAYRSDPVFTLYIHDSSLYSQSRDTTQVILDSHIHLLKKYLTEFKLTDKEKKFANKLLAAKLSNTAYLYGKKKDYIKAFSTLIDSFHYNMSFAQIRDLMKVLMTFVYIPGNAFNTAKSTR